MAQTVRRRVVRASALVAIAVAMPVLVGCGGGGGGKGKDGHRKILVTAFRPFDGREANVTEDVANSLNETKVNGVTIRTVVMPVEWGLPEMRIKRAVDRIREEGQTLIAILGLGECEGEKIEIEKRARNKRDATLKDDGRDGRKTPAERGLGEDITPGGPASRDSPLAKKLKDSLGDAAIESDDAGQYLCEESFYVALGLADSGFAHLPKYPRSNDNKEHPDNAAHLRRMQDAVKKMLEALAK